LKIIELQLPPIADRPDDILPLAEHFLTSRWIGRRRRARPRRAGGDGACQIDVRRAHYADIDLACRARPKPLEFSGLRHAEQLGLSGRRQVTDLVKEKRSTGGRRETTDPHLGRPRERPASAKKLSLQQLVRQRAHVDFLKQAKATTPRVAAAARRGT
jgi:hypothetical protein